jgi:superfamily I DNA/RNA helicase/very-short-patch-repair endonuclease
MATGPDTDEINGPLAWMDEILVERLRHGVPIIIFGSASLFDGEHFKSNEVGARFKDLRDQLPGLRITKLGRVAVLDPVKEGQRLHVFLNDVSNGQPRILFVEEPLEVFSTGSCAALDHQDVIGRLLIADKFRTAVLADAIHVDLSKPPILNVANDHPPMTPIEEKLHAAMSSVGVEVSCQVSFEPYVVDFLVSSDGNRVVVEADGAGFHDADSDCIRDERMKERHELETLRFTGSEIHADAMRCAQGVKLFLANSSEIRKQYPSEGFEVLDASQRAAVQHSGGDARVLAPAGSGKTKVLVNRVVSLLNQGVPPSRILVLAFNRKAAEQLEGRLGALGIPTGKGRDNDTGVWVATLNSFGNRVLLNEGITSQLLDKPWKERELVIEALHEMGEQLVGMRGEDPFSKLTREIARIRRGLRSPAELEVEVAQPGGRRAIAIDVLWSAVRDIQNRKGLITFDDQIFLATNLLLKDSMIRHIWQTRFRHVLVDEYQDLNDAQITLMRILTSGPAAIFAVGDDDQVIYSWRDANVVNLLENFKNSYPGMTDHLLEVNYRCAKPIVRTSQRLISINKRRHPKNIRPAENAPEGQVSIASAEGTMPLGDDLVGFLFAQRNENGRNWREMAVLTRTNVQLLAAAVALDRGGIPRSSLPLFRLYSTAVARRLLAYLSIVTTGQFGARGEDLAEVINRPNRFVKNEDVERLRTTKNAWILVNLWAHGCPVTIRSNKEIKTFIDGLLELFCIVANEACPAVDVVDGILARFKFAAERDEATRTADEATDEIILHVIREEARGFSRVEDFIEYMTLIAKEELGEVEPEDAPNKPDPEAHKDDDKVTISTIHGAKGREWPTVCMFDASRANSQSKRSDAEEEEERRVFYVGMTRAAVALHFNFVAGKSDPFLAEAVLPRGLIGKDDKVALRWVNDQTETLERKRHELEDTQGAEKTARDELSRLSSGERLHELERRRSDLVAMRDDLQSVLGNLSHEQPAGLFVRVFRGGRSSASISREMAVIGDRLSSLDDQVGENSREIDEARLQTEELIKATQERIERLEKAVNSLAEEVRKISGDMSDVQLAWKHLPLGS